MAVLSIIGIVMYWLGYEISNGFHSAAHYSSDYYWGTSPFWVYFAAYVVYLTTKNLQWLVRATTLNLILFPVSDIYV